MGPRVRIARRRLETLVRVTGNWTTEKAYAAEFRVSRLDLVEGHFALLGQ